MNGVSNKQAANTVEPVKRRQVRVTH